jgi:hypothetical protein
MTNAAAGRQQPEPLNAGEFMWAIIAATPPILRRVRGIVNVDVRLSLDAAGGLTAACATPLVNRQPVR